MKGDLTIKHAEYFTLLTELVRDLDSGNMPYFIFGGGGVQVAIGSALTKGTRDFTKEPALDLHLRKTSDIDIYIDAPSEQLIPALQELCFALSKSHPTLNCDLQSDSLTFGRAVVNYVTNPEDLKGFSHEVQRIFESSANSRLRKGNKEYNITLESPEYNLAAKLTGNKIKTKDEFDIGHLTLVLQQTGRSIKEEELKQILQRLNKPEAFETYKRIIAAYREGEKS